MIVIDIIPKRVDPHRAVMCIMITLNPFLNGLPVSFANLWKCSSGRKINFSAAMNVLTYANGPMLVSNVHTDFSETQNMAYLLFKPFNTILLFFRMYEGC